jgi:Kelch motif
MHGPVPQVYDIASGTWSTVGTLTVPASDQAVFTDGKAVYMVGGYDAGYDALATTTKLTLDSGALVQESKAALQYGRGDISAATDGAVAYVSGGWTDDDKFCVPQASVERYTVATDTWETLPDVMNIARADLGLVMLNEQLIALGGETALNTKCALNSSDVHELWAQTVAVDDVEVLDGDNWKFVSDLQDFRFRFAAVAVDAEETIFTFGGQQAFNSTCNCFRTSNQIVVYQELDHHAPPNSGAWSVVGPMVSIAAVVVAGLF